MNKEVLRFLNRLVSFTKELQEDKTITEEINAYLSGYADAIENIKEIIESS